MVREARSRVQSDETGKLYLIQGSYLQDWLMQAGDTNWRVDATAGGKSRAFADIGSHLCDVLEWITGERFTSLIATLGTPIAQRSAAASRVAFQASGEVKETKAVDTEDVACLILRTDRGTLATLTVSQVSAGRKNRLWFELDGAQQSVMFDLESPEQLWIGRREGMTAADARSIAILSRTEAPRLAARRPRARLGRLFRSIRARFVRGDSRSVARRTADLRRRRALHEHRGSRLALLRQQSMDRHQRLGENIHDHASPLSRGQLARCIGRHEWSQKFRRRCRHGPLGRPIGLQLYTVRDVAAKDLAGTLAKLQTIGYREVETAGFYGKSGKEMRKILADHGMTAPSAHSSMGDIQKDMQKLVDGAAEVGAKYFICAFPSLPPGKPLSPAIAKEITLDDWKWNAEQLNKLGEVAKKAGLQAGYHNHNMEFRTFDGATAFDHLLKLTDPKLVTIELDLGWVVTAGLDPAKYHQAARRSHFAAAREGRAQGRGHGGGRDQGADHRSGSRQDRLEERVRRLRSAAPETLFRRAGKLHRPDRRCGPRELRVFEHAQVSQSKEHSACSTHSIVARPGSRCSPPRAP